MAAVIAERCRQNIEDIAIEIDGNRIPVTSSFGVTTLPAGMHSSGDTLTHSADLGLWVRPRQKVATASSASRPQHSKTSKFKILPVLHAPAHKAIRPLFAATSAPAYKDRHFG